jgi:carbonic anhydrase
MSQHGCSAVVVSCMDYRIQSAVMRFASHNFEDGFDYLSMAGGPKRITDVITRSRVMDQLKLAKELHGVRKVLLIGHQDCGAYGGSEAFGELSSEVSRVVADMMTAKQLIKAAFRYEGVEVYLAFMTKNGRSWKSHVIKADVPLDDAVMGILEVDEEQDQY